jgi:hypothetical protein
VSTTRRDDGGGKELNMSWMTRLNILGFSAGVILVITVAVALLTLVIGTWLGLPRP